MLYLKIRLRKHSSYLETGLCEWQPEQYKNNPKMKTRWYKLFLPHIHPESIRHQIFEVFAKMRPGDKLTLEAEYDRTKKILNIQNKKIKVSKVVRDRVTLYGLIHELKQKGKKELSKKVSVSYPVKGTYLVTVKLISKGD